MGAQIIRKGILTRTEVDVLSEMIGDFLEKENYDRRTLIQIRMSMEDLILSVCEALGENTPYQLTAGKNIGRQFLRFSYEGDPFDPNDSSEDPSENWSNRIMSELGLAPAWQYKNGSNTLELRLKRKRIGSFGKLLIAIAAGAAFGFLGTAVLPEALRGSLCELFFKPLQGVFFHFLSAFAGIMILLSVSCGIFNMGDISSFSKLGKTMFRRFIGFTLILATAIAIISSFLFPTASGTIDSAEINVSGLSEVLNLIYEIVPGDPITPFKEGNAMQIVFLGVVIGVAILMLGSKTDHIKTAAEECNLLVNDILSFVVKLLPVYVFCLAIDMIWSDTFKLMVNIWKPFTAAAVICILLLLFTILYVSAKFKLSPWSVWKKLLPSFFICLSTAASVSAFSQTISDSTQKFGVDEKYVKVAVPIRSIIYMPALVTELIVVTYSMAQIYEVKVNISWMLLCVLICSILAIAVPPIPGADAMLFGIIFPQLGIPIEAMAFAVTLDAIFDFLGCAVNNSLGMLEFVLQADKLKMLDKELLRTAGA